MSDPLVPIMLFLILAYAISSLMAIKIIRPHEKGLVERLGRYFRTLEPGFNLVIPFVDTVSRVDMRETAIDIPPQRLVTSDKSSIKAEILINVQVVDPVKCRYKVNDYDREIANLAKSYLHETAGQMSLDRLMESRADINTKLRKELENSADKWGVKIHKAEIGQISYFRE